MCGIAGVFFTDPGRVADASLLDRMNATLAHRGPDDAGIHRDGPIGMANRRLAIIDLSPRVSADVERGRIAHDHVQR